MEVGDGARSVSVSEARWRNPEPVMFYGGQSYAVAGEGRERRHATRLIESRRPAAAMSLYADLIASSSR